MLYHMRSDADPNGNFRDLHSLLNAQDNPQVFTWLRNALVAFAAPKMGMRARGTPARIPLV